jgi:pyrroline-5-carboxylate reductase
MATRAYEGIVAANSVEIELEPNVVAFRVISDVTIGAVTYVDSARTIAATVTPTPATIIKVEDRAMGRYVTLSSTSPAYIYVIVEDAR